MLGIVDKAKSLFTQKEKLAPSGGTWAEIIRANEGLLFGPDSVLDFVNLHNTHVWVYRCTQVISDSAMRAEPVLNREYYKNRIRHQEPLGYDHPATKLINEPNQFNSRVDLIEEIFINWQLSGSWYVFYDDATEELWNMRSDYVAIEPDAQKYIKGFWYGAFSKDFYPADNVIHGKYYNPNNFWYGLSPMQAAKNSISQYLSAQKYTLSFFENYAIPLGYWKASVAPNKDEMDYFKEMLKKLYGGHKKYGSSAITNLEYKTINETFNNIISIELLKHIRDEIAAAFGIPSIYLNDTDKMDYANSREHQRLLWFSKMIPDLMKVGGSFGKFFNRKFPEKGSRIIMSWNLNKVEALREDVVKEAEASRILVSSGQREVNEARSLRGEPPLKHGDTAFVPMSFVRLEQAGDVLGMKTPATGEGKQSNIIEFKSIREGKARYEHWLKTKDIVTSNEARLTKLVRAIFTDWTEEMLANLRRLKMFKANYNVEDILFDTETGKAILTEAGEPIFVDSTRKGGERVMATLAVEQTFDLHDPRVEELINRATQRFAKHIAEENWERMKDSLQEGINAGENIKQLSERVEMHMGREIANAPTVARTEVLPRYHEGQIEGMRQSEIVERKEWMSAFAEHSREGHMAADGQTTDLDGVFEIISDDGAVDYLKYPGDPSGSASNIINCLCDVLPVIEEEKSISLQSEGRGKDSNVGVAVTRS